MHSISTHTLSLHSDKAFDLLVPCCIAGAVAVSASHIIVADALYDILGDGYLSLHMAISSAMVTRCFVSLSSCSRSLKRMMSTVCVQTSELRCPPVPILTWEHAWGSAKGLCVALLLPLCTD